MDPDLVVGVDSSTSATKAIAFDAKGAAVAEGRAAIAMTNPEPGYFEQAPEDWWGSTATALRQLCEKIDPRRIASLAISNQRETFAALDAEGRALRPGMVWLDDRAQPQVRRFGQSFGAERGHAINGKPLDVIPCLFRIMWMNEHEPEIVARTHKFADVHAFLSFRLTGRWITSTASADPTGMLDIRSFDWSHEILGAEKIDRARLPDLVRPGELVGEITREAAAATGLPAGLPLIAGGGDGQCAATGVAALRPGRAYANLGTAAVAGLYGAAPAIDLAFRTETAVAEDGYIYEMCLRAGTFLVDWLLAEMFRDQSPRRETLAALEAEAARLPVGAGGVVLTPYWQGAMTPHWDGDARGIIAGLSGSTKRAHLYRAIMEGIAIEIATCMEQAAKASGSLFDHYVAIGGGASSDLWLQILADVANKPVFRSTTTEASALGAGMVAAKGAGWTGSIRNASEKMAGEILSRFEPAPRQVSLYRELRELQTELWPLVAAWNRRLTEFARRGAS
jgi:sugar (pentulose or hexulose) kinase